MRSTWLIFLSLVFTFSAAYRYDPTYVQWNLNTNPAATDPLEYSGEWTGHQYTPSPDNWRFPFYTLFLDRFVNGDPTNDNINGTLFEHDLRSNQIRHGGDLQGLIDTLDYLQGMGIKGLYIAGSPFINAPWGYDQYSPLDLTILDQHFGTLQKWREAIDAIHERGMYVLLDNTFATLGDLIGFEGYLNATTPFTLQEHKAQWKTDRQYWDFEIGYSYNKTCSYPRFWLETGEPLGKDITDQMIGCYDGEFDQYGDTEAFGVYPDWRRQLSKFASVQDRLRDWHEPVRAKIEHFYCLLIGQLDIDGYRYDKATQSTVDAMGYMNHAMRTCARKYGKNNFFTPGEITGGNVFGSIFLGRGRQPDQMPDNLTQAVMLNHSDSDHYIREANYSALDSAAFHYTTYRTLTRFLGMDGNLEAGYDSPKNWVDQWNDFLLSNDFVNSNTGLFDPRHMYGVTNQDVFRWPAIVQGVERQLLGHFITTLTMPGIPLLLWGEEQAFNILDNTAPNYIFGRQPISSALAWMQHGCYLMNSTQYYQMPLESARTACYDEKQSYDRRDPAHPVRNILKRMYQLRDEYPVLNDGMYLQQLSNQTYYYTLPGSAGTPTEFGVWSVFRSQFYPVQNLSAAGGKGDLPIWLLYTNMNRTTTFEFECSNNDTGRSLKALVSPFDSGTKVKNLLYPYDEHMLVDSAVKLGFNGTENFNGCLNNMKMAAYGFAAYVPIDKWVRPKPMVTSFVPGHDARLITETSEGEVVTIPVELHFSAAMDCNSVTESITFDSTTASGLIPSIDNSSVICGITNSTNSTQYVANIPGTWFWKANLTGVDHGIHALILNNPHSAPVHVPALGQFYNNNNYSCSVAANSTVLGNTTVPLGTNSTRSLIRRNSTGDVSFPYLTNLTQCFNTTNHTSRETFRDWTNTTDRFLFRIGRRDNPMIFPLVANYSSTLLKKDSNGGLVVHHGAPGADQWRYSTNWGSSFSDWMPYTGDSNEIEKLPWSGTSLQKWKGEHIRVEYHSRLIGTSDIVQEGDLDFSKTRRFPHLFLNGPFNEYGFDAGVENRMVLTDNNTWQRHLMDEWTSAGMITQVNVWGTNPDGQPDQSYVYGDIDGDSVLDRLPPSSLASVVLNITSAPVRPYLGWKLIVDDGTLRFQIVPSGNMWPQIILYILLCVMPVVTGIFGVWLFVLSFYRVKNNKVGIVHKISLLRLIFCKAFEHLENEDEVEEISEKPGLLARMRDRKNKFRQSTGNLVSADQRKKVLIATMEYDIEDWKIKVKIGGLGVMAQLMGKNLAHQDLIWVVPCVGGIEYPQDQAADPMTVIIMGREYDVQVQYHQLRNITYVLLDAPVFRQQTQAEPYPPRMDDMPSAIYYSAWNQCIAQAINRFPIHLYHINDYHGSAAPLYLLPRTIPACLSLHNAEFQGLWPMRTKEESEEVCSVFNLPEDVVQRYVQFGEVFNLLHAGASYLREHQAGFGAVGVSKKYGKRAYARYPIFWGLKRVGQLPNPDPSDTGEWDKKLPKESDIQIDPEFEARRPELRRQAQEWAGLDQNPNAELFVFVGRWSMQKGIDLIADVFPSLIESNPNIQLVTVGPVIDLYGKFAATKLDQMMKVYPGRVCSKPVFTQIPPCVFSGAEFALIPSRDEPFGLVAVEFGRKGALGVGARVGGLGQMPGWWYTVESTTTGHLLQQFRIAIQEALSSKPETRALMRARSAKQRFPVAQWVEDLEILQSTAVRIHDTMEGQTRHAVTAELMGGYPGFDPYSANATPWGSLTPAGLTPSGARTPSGQRTPRFKKHRSLTGLSERLDRLKDQSENGKLRKFGSGKFPPGRGGVSLGTRKGPGHIVPRDIHDGVPQIRHLPSIPRLSPIGDVDEAQTQFEPVREDEEYDSDDSDAGTESTFDAANSALEWMITRLNHQYEDRNFDGASQTSTARDSEQATIADGGFGIISIPDPSRPTSSEKHIERPTPYLARERPSPYVSTTNSSTKSLSKPTTPTETHAKSGTRITFGEVTRSRPVSTLSVDTVVGDKTDYKLQQVEPFFTDSTGQYLRDFETRLEGLNGSNSYKTCIEEYLIKSERKWFDSFRDAKLGRKYPPTIFDVDISLEENPRDVSQNLLTIREVDPDQETPRRASFVDEFLLGRSYVPPSGLRKWMQVRIGDWPIYSFFLAFGQIVAANSYQVTLLTGEVGQTANKLYAISSIYLATTICWWLLYRRYPSILCLSLPFFLYGLAFLLVGFAHFNKSYNGQGWIQNIGTAFYAAASSSGWVFFALNFGDDGGTETSTIMFRACVIQGTQQLYIVGLWFWGSYLSRRNTQGLLLSNPISQSWRVTAICVPIALLFWTVGLFVWFGLPNYYRQHPGQVRSFYRSLLRRKIVLWFFLTVAIQNFFLSAPYGRNWAFLWKSKVAQPWQIIVMIVFFFVIVWAAFLWLFGWLSKFHTWILPLFAIGLGAPRWAQIWWATSNVGLYLPWAGTPLASALASRALWLWLGTLDSIQGVGLGMILLATLTRVHVAFTLVMAQVIGSVFTMLARSFAPNNVGPGPISPDISESVLKIFNVWFWIGLAFNLLICVGFYMFYRKEQLSKP